MANIIIRNAGWIVTMDGQRRIITNGAVKIKDSLIAEIGKNDEVKDEPGFKVIDASRCIVMPGLINGHFHVTQQLARGLADNVFLPTWIHDRIYPYEHNMTTEDVYISTHCACIEAIKTGTTCFIDPGGFNMEFAAKAVEEIGIRGILSRSMTDIHATGRPLPGKMNESTDAALAAGEEFVVNYNGKANGRIRAWFSCRTERMVSNQLIRRAKELADKYKTGIESHVSSYWDSVNRHKEIHDGLTPLKRYHLNGVVGPNLLIYHTNYLTDEEIQLCKEYDVKSTHCPTAGWAGGYGALLAKHPEMIEMGIAVAVGSDNAPESNTNDMFRVMFALGAHRDVHRDATLFTPEKMLDTVIRNGSRCALWEDEIGSLEVGKKADLIVVGTEGPEWYPLLNPISNLTMAAAGDSVKHSVIDGEIVMFDRVLTNVDEKEMLERGQASAERIARDSGLDYFARPKWPVY